MKDAELTLGSVTTFDPPRRRALAGLSLVFLALAALVTGYGIRLLKQADEVPAASPLLAASFIEVQVSFLLHQAEGRFASEGACQRLDQSVGRAELIESQTRAVPGVHAKALELRQGLDHLRAECQSLRPEHAPGLIQTRALARDLGILLGQVGATEHRSREAKPSRAVDFPNPAPNAPTPTRL